MRRAATANLLTGADGTASTALAPGKYSVTATYANGYQTQTLTISPASNTITFSTVPATVQINDPAAADIAAATVTHAGNTGTYGPKTPVNSNGQVTFQVLPGTNTFTAWDGNNHQSVTLTITSTTIPVS